jgi:D-glycero-D-manno-heptose 1,7-bisphosphate phosphatase
MEKVVFLDRDGVISKDSPDHIKSWEEFHFLPRVKDAIRLLTENEFNIIVITNQSVIARGMTTVDELEQMHANMVKEIEKEGGKIVDIYYCPHHPDDGCSCRKPEPGMLLKAIKDHNVDSKKSFMVGDRMMDVKVGKKVGTRAIIIPSKLGKKEMKEEKNIKPDYIAKDLYDASKWIIKNY